MPQSPDDNTSLGTLLGNARTLLLKDALAVWQHVVRSDPGSHACANAYKVPYKVPLLRIRGKSTCFTRTLVPVVVSVHALAPRV